MKLSSQAPVNTLIVTVSDSATPWTVTHQGPLSMGFSRQEYWNELPFPSPGDIPDPGIEPRSPSLQADSLPLLRSWHLIPSLMANRWGNNGNMTDFIFLGSKTTADGDCSHEIKRHLLLGRKLDSVLKSRDITLLTKVCLVKAMVFPVAMYGCENWTIKKAEH